MQIVEKETAVHEKSLQIVTFTLNARLKPLAKKPPNGAINDENKARKKAWICMGYIQITAFSKPNYVENKKGGIDGQLARNF